MKSDYNMEYRGYTIEPETNPWAKLFGIKFKFFIDGEKIYSADSEDEAIEIINSICDQEENLAMWI